ncbi:hypothetical protein [Streptomyces sp. WMMC940]|uniref:hypothetical protein n=1 Tax=Streptomyces sp. WMMC940 TaxID=3015153 RepID=UPI0022B64C8D|nr:hypothetical protein [Streptomyces sp. WMMC940]MCZ7458903.1 hypothetical protein [Streptomyces sp. WMMC940]MCZ7462417.1 hypothetical protein [Streptomyces sp. WMMC940]
MSKETESSDIRVMADYGCHPLWLTRENDNVSPTDPQLGLTPILAERLSEWAQEFDRILCLDDPASSGFPSPEAEANFAESGERLARKLAQELGPSWKVGYFDLRIDADREIPYML